MREIKFRKYDVFNKIWNIYDLEQIGYFGEVNWDNNESVGQYTGLKDKNGKEIYEGDIIKDSNTSDLYEVVYSDEHACFMGKDIGKFEGKWGLRGAFVILGNIYENPELIK